MADQNQKENSKRSEKDKKYDQEKRERVFQSAWKVTYPWLDYDPQKKVMSCSTCKRCVFCEEMQFLLNFHHTCCVKTTSKSIIIILAINLDARLVWVIIKG